MLTKSANYCTRCFHVCKSAVRPFTLTCLLDSNGRHYVQTISRLTSDRLPILLRPNGPFGKWRFNKRQPTATSCNLQPAIYEYDFAASPSTDSAMHLHLLLLLINANLKYNALQLIIHKAPASSNISYARWWVVLCFAVQHWKAKAASSACTINWYASTSRVALCSAVNAKCRWIGKRQCMRQQQKLLVFHNIIKWYIPTSHFAFIDALHNYDSWFKSVHIKASKISMHPLNQVHWDSHCACSTWHDQFT